MYIPLTYNSATGGKIFRKQVQQYIENGFFYKGNKFSMLGVGDALADQKKELPVPVR